MMYGKMSSTWTELEAVESVLCSLLPILEGENIYWFTDYTNVVSIVRKKSMKIFLQEVAMKVYKICLVYKFRLEI